LSASAEFYTLRNTRGAEATVLNYGARIVTLKVPDRDGSLADVVLGFDSPEPYLSMDPPPPYFGAVIGRFGNRIAHGKFRLNGVGYTLAKNNRGMHHIHGGLRGFDKVFWTRVAGEGITLEYLSRDGEEGYPGNLSCRLSYTLDDAGQLRIDYSAVTDADTIVNLTNHSFFNLAGHDSGDIFAHEVEILADYFTPIDAGLIPTGELRSVDGTPFDFRAPKAIGAGIGVDDEQLKYGGGYDHNFVLRRSGAGLELAARVVEPKSGRMLEVLTTEPGMQFYSGNFLDGKVKGKAGTAYAWRSAFCLETQHFPDAPNQPGFPDTVLKPGDEYRSTTVYRFSAR
jgi:aldose 1-epimerase